MARFEEFHQGEQKILINVRTVEGVFVDEKGNTIIITTSCVEEDSEWLVDESYEEVKAKLKRKTVK